MSELKAFNMPRYAGEFTMHEVYLKPEADKVIADLEERHKKEVGQLLMKIAELQEKLKVQTSIAEEGWKEFRTYHTSYAEAVKELYDKNKELRHHKYKRCLAMAKECDATALWCYQAANTLPTGFKATLSGKPVMIEPDRLYNRFERLIKWSNRWMKLAEQFKDKEAK